MGHGLRVMWENAVTWVLVSFLLCFFFFLAPLMYSVKSMLAPYPQAEQPTIQTF